MKSIYELIQKRLLLVQELGNVKRALGMPLEDKAREEKILQMGSTVFEKKILESQMVASKLMQQKSSSANRQCSHDTLLQEYTKLRDQILCITRELIQACRSKEAIVSMNFIHDPAISDEVWRVAIRDLVCDLK